MDVFSLYSNHKFENNSISGFINFENLTIEDSEEIRYSFSNFENFISNHSNQTIKSALVFPVFVKKKNANTNFPVFVIHLFPWISEKANTTYVKGCSAVNSSSLTRSQQALNS